MANYDVNLQLALATSAEASGQLDDALAYLAMAHVHAQDDRDAHARVHWLTAQFHARRRSPLRVLQQLALSMLVWAL